MAFFPKKHFQWREPKGFLQMRDAEERAKRRWWHLPLAALSMSAMVMLSWYVARFDPHKHPLPFETELPVALVVGVLFAYGLAWLYALSPSEVRLYDAYLTRVRGNTNWRVKYSALEHFSWRMTQEHTTLVLKQAKGRRELLIGLPSDLPKYEVNLFLLSRGVMPKPGE